MHLRQFYSVGIVVWKFPFLFGREEDFYAPPLLLVAPCPGTLLHCRTLLEPPLVYQTFKMPTATEKSREQEGSKDRLAYHRYSTFPLITMLSGVRRAPCAVLDTYEMRDENVPAHS